MSVTTVRLDDELKSQLLDLAESRDRSESWIIREAIKEYVEREAAEDRFIQEAEASWKEYQETGLHLTLDEVSKWLDTWGTGVKTPLPKCHK